MKVAYINSVAGYGSTGRLVEMLGSQKGIEPRMYYGRIAAALDRNHHDTPDFGISDDKRSFYFGSSIGFARHMAMTFLIDDHGFESTSETRRMIEDLKTFQPDLVHLHNLHGYYLNAELLFDYLKESGVRTIWTMHDCWVFTGHCAHYTSVHCMKWKTGCERCPALSHYPPTFNGFHVKENYERKQRIFGSLPVEQLSIATPSEWLRDEVKVSFLGKYAVTAVPNGIDETVFYRRKSSFRKDHQLEDRFVILAVAGSWYKEKGTDDILAVSKQLKDNEALVVVGASGSFAKELHKNGALVIKRTENAAQLAEIYSSGDVLINPTREDTFPTVNIEALACGCPVITYNTGGSPEILDADTGIVVESERSEALFAAMESMNQKQRFFRADDCIRRAKRYTRAMMLEGYRQLYRLNETGE